MGLNAIPKRVLIHSAVYREKTADGGIVSLPSSTDCYLDKILIQGRSGVNFGVAENGNEDSAVLFYDCKHSLPKAVCFKEGSQIIWEGKAFTIVGIKKCTTFKSDLPHHYELMLA